MDDVLALAFVLDPAYDLSDIESVVGTTNNYTVRIDGEVYQPGELLCDEVSYEERGLMSARLRPCEFNELILQGDFSVIRLLPD